MKEKTTKKAQTRPEIDLTESKVEKILNETLKSIDSEIQNFSKIKQLESFKLLQHLLNKNKKKNYFKKILSHLDIFIYLILIIFFACYLALFINAYNSPDKNLRIEFSNKINLAYKWLISKWMYLNEFTDLTKEPCALILPDFSNSITRPIDDCSMCSNLTEIKRITNITKEEFLDKYAYTAVPVVITGAIQNWSALKVFNFEFLKNLYLNLDEKEYRLRQSKLEIHEENSKNKDFFKPNVKKPSSAILNTFNFIIENDNDRSMNSKITCQFFPYKTKFKNLEQVFGMELDENGKWLKPWYVGWSNCNNYASNVLREHYERPYFLPDEAEMSRLDWIFMGTPGYGADMHIDDVNNPSWQAQISGIKHWTFKPPAECLLKCPFSLRTDVYPGDIIIFDSNRWFHSTLIIGNDLSLTIGSEYD